MNTSLANFCKIHETSFNKATTFNLDWIWILECVEVMTTGSPPKLHTHFPITPWIEESFKE
jgi:hypothetical protein